MTARRPGSAPGPDERRRARAEAIRWAASAIANPDVLFLDTETTGLDSRAEIVEVAVVDALGAVCFETFVRPDSPIPADAARIHGIDDGMVAGAPHWRDVCHDLTRLVSGRQVVVYNATFDHRLVNQMNQRCGFPAFDGEWQCAMRQYAAFAAEWHERHGDYRFHPLDAALAAFGHPPGGHRARADALACRLVIVGMAGSER